MSENEAAGQGTCHVKTLAVLAVALEEWGLDVGQIFDAGGVKLHQLEDFEGRITLDAYRRVWEKARKVTCDEAIGLHVLDSFEPRHAITAYVYMASTSATPREAYERVQPFIRVANSAADVELRVEDERTIFRASFDGFDDEVFLIEYFFGLIVKVAPLVVGTFPIREICFAHSPPAYADEYRETFGIDVRFDAPYNAIIGSAADLDNPLPNADAVLCALLEQQAVSALGRMPKTSTFVENARSQIGAQLEGGDVSAESVAKALGLSDRTLRRRLNDGGVGYQELLDSVRCERARQALAKPGDTVGEVAFSLGFSDTSAFHKAFRRWTGTRPSDWKSAQR